jgi:hypothetical protein
MIELELEEIVERSGDLGEVRYELSIVGGGSEESSQIGNVTTRGEFLDCSYRFFVSSYAKVTYRVSKSFDGLTANMAFRRTKCESGLRSER